MKLMEPMEAANYLGVAYPTLMSKTQQAKGNYPRSMKTGTREVMFNKLDLDLWLLRHRRGPYGKEFDPSKFDDHAIYEFCLRQIREAPADAEVRQALTDTLESFYTQETERAETYRRLLNNPNPKGEKD